MLRRPLFFVAVNPWLKLHEPLWQVHCAGIFGFAQDDEIGRFVEDDQTTMARPDDCGRLAALERDQFGCFAFSCAIRRTQAFDDTGAIRFGAVLAHLEFAFEASDWDADADDAA